jgi:hypothetical protein
MRWIFSFFGSGKMRREPLGDFTNLVDKTRIRSPLRREARVKAFLASHPHLHLHFTPTYSSWLNQVELWFARSNAT